MTSPQTTDRDAAQEERNEALPGGTHLLDGEFTITDKLGNGGFGITYLAKDNYLDRDVVIKECFPEVFCHRAGKSVLVRSTANQDKYRSIVQMFMREARSIAKLRHPNVIGVHRVFEDNDTAYMALDLIDGRDLLDIIKRDRDALRPAQIVNILTKLLDAIDLIHQQDLLHRDISPDNILLDKWGSPVLIDFGAAREEASRETRAMSAVLVVKDGYSPQEFYFAGGKQTPCSDLYALAATFYHVISGEVPPNSQTRMAEVAGGSEDPCVPLAGRFKEYDSAFLAAIDTAMRVLPKERLQSARAWADMIDPTKARAAPLVLSKKNNLGATLNRLISETNDYVLKSAPVEEKKPAPTVPKERRVVPDWVREFNEESLAPDAPVRNRAEPKAPPLRLEPESTGPARAAPLVLGTPKSAGESSPEPVHSEPEDASKMPSRLRAKLRHRMSMFRSSWR